MARSQQSLAFVLPHYNPKTSGHFGYTLELARSLGNDFSVHLFIESSSVRNPKLSGFSSVYVQRFSFPLFSLIERCIYFSFLRLKGCRRFYVHYSYFSGVIAALICRLSFGKSFYWHCEQKDRYKGNFTSINGIARRLLQDFPFWLVLRLCSVLITATPIMKKYYRSMYQVPAKKIAIAPNWVDVAKIKKEVTATDNSLRKKLLASSKKHIVLFVHWLSPRKGSRFIVPIVEHVIAKNKDVLFVIVGDGPDFKLLKDDIAKHKLSPHINLCGSIPNTDVFRYFSASDVFMMPSREEEFGRVVIETMAAGVPIVTFDTYGPQAILNDAQKKCMVPNGDFDAFAKSILKILSNKSFRDSLTKEGYDRVTQYDKDVAVKAFTRIFKA